MFKVESAAALAELTTGLAESAAGLREVSTDLVGVLDWLFPTVLWTLVWDCVGIAGDTTLVRPITGGTVWLAAETLWVG